jgi:hypothetical protein
VRRISDEEFEEKSQSDDDGALYPVTSEKDLR